VALFHILFRLKDTLGFRLAACHLNHHIRGRESDEDARFVREFVKMHGVRCYMGSRRIPAKRKAQGGSMEEVARRERYAFYRRTAAKCGATCIAVGHTSDDNAETVLFNLLRGSGIRGLAGIRVKRREGDLTIIRPLLHVAKSRVLRYLKSQGLSFRVDSTNLDQSYTRNSIRLRLLPYLRRHYNRNITSALSETSTYLRTCTDFIETEIETFAQSSVKGLENGFSVPVTEYLRLHPALRELAMKDLLERSFETKANNVLLTGVESLATKKGKYRIALPGGVMGVREYGNLVFVKEGQKRPPAGTYDIRIPSSLMMAEWSIEIGVVQVNRGDIPDGYDRIRREPMGRLWRRVTAEGETAEITEYLDRGKIASEYITVRPRKPGDRYRPLGMSGTRSLKKLLIDEKLPISLRERVPVLSDSHGIVYVPGYRIADSLRVTSESVNVLKLNVRIFPL
jgi:tRNA(Ile)-lysidine synthase